MKRRFQRANLLLGITALCLLISTSCTQETTATDEAIDRTTALGAAAKNFQSQDWASSLPEDITLATVNGVNITERSLQLHADTPPSRAKKELRTQLIAMEVLAQKAASLGYGLKTEVLQKRKKAVARAFLKEIFEKQVTPESIPQFELRKRYEQAKYIWWRAYDETRAIHIIETCCDARGDSQGCYTKEAQLCFSEGEARMKAYRVVLAERAAETPHTVAAFQDLLGTFRREIGASNPYLMYEELGAIKYIPGMPYEEQTQFTRFDPAVVEALYEVDTFELTPTVQSKFGWHLLVKIGFYGARQLGPGDPTVVREIQEKIFPSYQVLKFNQALSELKGRYQPVYDDAGLAILDGLLGQTPAESP